MIKRCVEKINDLSFFSNIRDPDLKDWKKKVKGNTVTWWGWQAWCRYSGGRGERTGVAVRPPCWAAGGEDQLTGSPAPPPAPPLAAAAGPVGSTAPGYSRTLSLLCNKVKNVCPDPAFHSDADPDPTFQFDSNLDPDPTVNFFPDLDTPMFQNYLSSKASTFPLWCGSGSSFPKWCGSMRIRICIHNTVPYTNHCQMRIW